MGETEWEAWKAKALRVCWTEALERREPWSLQSTDQPVHVRIDHAGGQERPTKRV